MEDLLATMRPDGWIRDSFLIDKKPTQVEITRVKALFRQIEEVLMKIENLRRKSRASGCKFDVKWQIYEERQYLLAMYELLKEILIANKVLQDQFIFDIRSIERKVEKVLGNRQYLSGTFLKSARIDF